MALKRTAAVAPVAIAAAILFGTVAGQAQDAPGGGPSSLAISNEGKEVYETICQACHMADAKGGGGAGAAIPALAGNANLKDKDFIVNILLKGRGGMPWFTDMLSRKQMASVATYVRGHFNAYPDAVTEADVDRLAALSPPSPRDCATC
jgi:mono/diheme cytochrome c family protein